MGPLLLGRALLALTLLGTALAVWRFRRYGILLLLWLPLAFYALSIAYGSVPIYVPVWYPFSYYNVRYGLELLPVFAVFLAILAGYARRESKHHVDAGRRLVCRARAGRHQLCFRLRRITHYIARSRHQLAGPHRAGARAGERAGADAAVGHAADVRGRTRRSAAAWPAFRCATSSPKPSIPTGNGRSSTRPTVPTT